MLATGLNQRSKLEPMCKAQLIDAMCGTKRRWSKEEKKKEEKKKKKWINDVLILPSLRYFNIDC